MAGLPMNIGPFSQWLAPGGATACPRWLDLEPTAVRVFFLGPSFRRPLAPSRKPVRNPVAADRATALCGAGSVGDARDSGKRKCR
jgi:hypothetical protein